jgi:hypothetical protein
VQLDSGKWIDFSHTSQTNLLESEDKHFSLTNIDDLKNFDKGTCMSTFVSDAIGLHFSFE